MNVLAFTFGVPFITERDEVIGNFYLLGEEVLVSHDSAAVLISDGKILEAVEEERLNRVKHSDKAPILALRYCLESNHMTLKDIDYVTMNFEESFLDYIFKHTYLEDFTRTGPYTARMHVQRVLKEAFGEGIDDSKILFTNHHQSHGESAFAMSGFQDSLVMVIDGRGDDSSGFIQSRRGDEVELLDTISLKNGLGYLYMNIINYLGYRLFDEYKVMGLAPYGNPEVYRNTFKEFYELLPNGKYVIHQHKYQNLFKICLPRRKGEEFSQIHKDIAAALQYMLEDIVLHMVKYHAEKTGQVNLCLAGGVAHNCSAVGKLLETGLFKEIYVQPAAHDPGTALGAAVIVAREKGNERLTGNINHVYLGPDLDSTDVIEEKLKKWAKYLSYEKKENITKATAELINNGQVIGWVQGRSEFGRRALGNRSILADPRPFENKRIINEMVKKRESYRPFAPSILQEYIEDYIELPTEQRNFPFMNFVLRVKEEQQDKLQAITHVDGTARVQTVSKSDNPKYWELINEFGKLSGFYILLNTSFNNNAEPIVDSVEDAIVCYLTTDINYLVIDNYLISKKKVEASDLLDAIICLKPYTHLCSERRELSNGELKTDYYLSLNFERKSKFVLSKTMFRILSKSDGKATVNELLERINVTEFDKSPLVKELKDIWSDRFITLQAEL